MARADGQPKFTEWYGFDTENDKNGVVTLAALINEGGESWIWKRAGCFKEWCEGTSIGQRPVVICHNLEYDLVNEFGDDYCNLQLNYLKGRLISAKYGRVSFLDSFNHCRMSLKAIGSAIGIEKGELDIYDEAYVTQDAWICLQVMVRLRDYIAGLGGEIGATSGSSAVSVWAHMTDEEFFTGPFDTKFLRQGYYGGRTEIFQRHVEGDIKGFDINSMYPGVMMNEFPEYMTMDRKWEKAKGMADVTISIPHDVFVAPLPYRDVSNHGSLSYPVGVFRGTWTYDEIRHAEEVGGKVLEVHQAIGCNAVVRPFDEFITTLYNKRKVSTDSSERLALKVLMNSLYGKLASKNLVTRVVSRYNLLKNGSKRIDDVKWINHNRGLLDYTTPPQPYVNVLWGAMITAYSRMQLGDYLRDTPDKSLIYCDTDSVYCEGFDMPTGPELGEMKLETSAKIMTCVQPKAYRLDDKYVAKGVPKPRKIKKENGDQIVVDFAKQYIEDGGTEFEAPIRFRASITSKRGKANEWIKHSKSMKTEYKAKTLSGNRYYPPVRGIQSEMALGDVGSAKTTRTRKTKA